MLHSDRQGAALAIAGGAVVVAGAWLLFDKQRRASQASVADEPFLQLINPASYRAHNPPWLIEAAAAASSRKYAPLDASSAVPPPVREAVQRLRDAVANAGDACGLLGAAARSSLFMLEKDAVYLNHGSYGAALKVAIQAQHYFQERLEAQPVRFMETEALQALRQAQLALAQVVGSHPADLVFVSNATTAVNAVLRSIQLGPGDLLLIATTTYPAVRSAAARVAQLRGAALLEVELLDVLDQPAAIIQRYQAALQAGGGRVRLAVLDHIISQVPSHLPVAALCALCREHGAASLVDGAHAVGALPLRIPELGCDYYTSNAHKWLCSGKGVAFLWAAQERQAGLLPLVTSHGHGLGFQGEFLWPGTSDMTAAMALPTAIAVMQALEPAATQYRRQLLRAAVALLSVAWGTQGVLGVQAKEATMCSVEMPPLSGRPPSAQLAGQVHAALRQRYRIEVPVACVRGRLWCRVSAQVYNELGEYQQLADAVKALAAEA
ncbi:hypothetical protein D9Q98_007016 [Chlorella vulgaris]|uniref:Aminotransferase class V domain-containing protein n=1 Tax=Chlorella vulgaris TaxID=3077 RepID=A0A9D4TJC6_CHLVU|nr:hypothetical protein D9Q98_007016 [Chlorella vulgaris]